MCIIACDCNKRPTLSANSLREFAIDADHALAATAKLCGIVPWGEFNFLIIQFILPKRKQVGIFILLFFISISLR